MTFGFSFLKFLKNFIPDVCIAVMVCIAGFLTRYATIDATNIVGITINAVIKLAIMGGVYVIGLILFRQYKYFIEIIHIKKHRK